MHKHNIPLMWKVQHSTPCGMHNIPLHVEKQLSTLCGQNSFYPPCVGRNICFIKNHYFNISLLNVNQRNIVNYIKSRLINDIETNPGPGEKLRIITINCRGLRKIDKF
jgi:hypothetical protein